MDDYYSIKKLKDKVEYCLKNYPETRNSDITLTIKIWRVFHSDKLFNEGKCIYIDNLFELPREDNIKRIRAKIQNDDGEYLPTVWEIAKRRSILREVWEKAMGYFRRPEISSEQSHLL